MSIDQPVIPSDSLLLSRRRLLKSALLCMGACLTGFPRSAFAVPPAAVLAIVQTAVTVASLLSKSGPSLADLMQVQTELLLKISQQLAVIQEGINTIIEQLQEVKRLVRELPAAVVNESNIRSVQGTVIIYRELLASYDEERKKDLTKANERLATRLHDHIIVPIVAARGQLLAVDSALTVPVLATAFQIEMQSMIRSDESHERMRTIIETYRDWFSRAIGNGGSIVTAQADARKERERLIAAVQKLTYRGYCTDSRTGLWDGMNWPTGFPQPRSEFRGHTALFGFTLEPEGLPPDVDASVRSLVTASELAAGEVPQKVVPGERREYRSIEAMAIGDHVLHSTIPGVHPRDFSQNRDSTARFPQCTPNSLDHGEKTSESTTAEVQLAANSDRLMALAALSSCAKETLARIAKLSKELEAA